MITARAMRTLWRMKWAESVGWDKEDPERIFSPQDCLIEDVQDQSAPMVIIGTDVVNLYPALDIDEMVKLVGEAVVETRIKFDEVDYLEAARYVALNWSKEKCNGSALR